MPVEAPTQTTNPENLYTEEDSEDIVGPEGEANEAAPEAPERPAGAIDDPDVAIAAEDQVLDERSEIIVEKGFDSIVSIITQVQGAEGNGKEELINSAITECQKFFNGLSREAAKERVESADKFLSVLKMEAVGVDFGDAEKARVQQILCEPLLRGHLSAEAMQGLAARVQVRSGEEMKRRSKEIHGYEGVMFSDGKGTIILSKEVLTGEFKADDGSEIDVRHCLMHESAHTAVEDVFHSESAEDRGEAHDAGQKFADEVIALAAEAKINRVPQSRHIETVLEMLEDLDGAYERLPEGRKSQQSAEEFKKERKFMASKEILTDYTAIYLQSDGTGSGFLGACISKVEPNQMFKYLTSDMASGSSEQELKKQLADTINLPSAEKVDALKNDPRLSKFKETIRFYGKFFDMAKKHITDSKLRQAAEVRLNNDDGSEFDLDSVGRSGNWDGVGAMPEDSGKGAMASSQEGSLVNAAGQTIKSFADGVDLNLEGLVR